MALLLTLLFAAFWGLPYGILCTLIFPLRRAFGCWWVFIFPFCWVAVEFLFPSLFPYFQGLSQYRVLPVFQLASVFGVYGVTYLVILTNSALANLLFEIRDRQAGLIWYRLFSWLPLGLVCLLWMANFTWGMVRLQNVERKSEQASVARIALLQQAYSMEEMITWRGEDSLAAWLVSSQKIKSESISLMIWPEASVLYNPARLSTKQRLSDFAKEGGVFFLTGGDTLRVTKEKGVRKYEQWNSAYVFSPDGEIEGRYDKMIRLPFGEYLPWPFDFLEGKISGVGNLVAGKSPVLFHTNSFTFTTPICYEAILENQMRKMMEADVIINITNDAWFGPFYNNTAAHQHAMLAEVNAVEFGRPFVRSATTGINLVVEPTGKVVYETMPFTEAGDIISLRLITLKTPYRTWGRYFPHFSTGIALMALGIVFWRLRQRLSK